MKTCATALILFAKAPELGQVKTRLHPFLDHETIYNLYCCFLMDSIDKLCAIQDVDGLIGACPANRLGWFDEVAANRGVRVFPQEGDDLGQRMRAAFCRRFKEKYEKVLIMGSDSPSLPKSYIESALQSEQDVILGPSMDGGYYLVGLNRRITEIFNGVSWGSESVLAQTLDQVKQAEASLDLLPLWYDVDAPESLAFLATHLKLLEKSGDNPSPFTKDCLAELNVCRL
ncbi:MAG: TIGR04282 family arsenosugar biosynthesis glycosyltransferase [Nitrospinota bacterium]|nr:TIGR04282 family arsenosugar biosynthesis glycosyltransferase [Nitrospinota bacterium]